MTAHWGIEDPAAVEGTAIQKEASVRPVGALSQEPDFHFRRAWIRSLDKMALNAKLRAIGAPRRRDKA